jgi:hypothetical protein
MSQLPRRTGSIPPFAIFSQQVDGAERAPLSGPLSRKKALTKPRMPRTGRRASLNAVHLRRFAGDGRTRNAGEKRASLLVKRLN